MVERNGGSEQHFTYSKHPKHLNNFELNISNHHLVIPTPTTAHITVNSKQHPQPPICNTTTFKNKKSVKHNVWKERMLCCDGWFISRI
jgi:hypothetical protein